MEFRPCIDIHNGKVKQIIGGSLNDAGDAVKENFVSEQNADFFAHLYKETGVVGGHIILLNGKESICYEQSKEQARLALCAYPGGMQVGGGITPENAKEFLEMGASHVIVTSYVFWNGRIDYDRLSEISKLVGPERLVLDVSCRRRGEEYYIVTDRWQKFTQEKMSADLLDKLGNYCAEFLVHAVDVEGKEAGIEEPLVQMLGEWEGLPVTYAGGIGNFEDLERVKKLGKNKIDVTIGSALDLFGGPMEYEKVLAYFKETRNSCLKE